MRTVLLAALLLPLSARLLGAPLPAAAKRGELIVNGSFEDGPKQVDRWLPLDKGSKQIKGWVVTRGQIDLIDSYWQAARGKRSIDLHGSPGNGGISQTIKTRPGRTYKVTFRLAGNPGGARVKVIGVSAAGKKTSFAFDTAGKTLEKMGWVKKTWEFKATARETTLEFYTLTENDTSWGPVIDDVSLVGDLS
jgi:choice-of-anchor C domain-containing protein